MVKKRKRDDELRELRVSKAVHAKVKALAEMRGHKIPTTATELLESAIVRLGEVDNRCKQCGSRDITVSKNEPIKCGACDAVREM